VVPCHLLDGLRWPALGRTGHGMDRSVAALCLGADPGSLASWLPSHVQPAVVELAEGDLGFEAGEARLVRSLSFKFCSRKLGIPPERMTCRPMSDGDVLIVHEHGDPIPALGRVSELQMKSLQAIYKLIPGAGLPALLDTGFVHREERVVIVAHSRRDGRSLICHLTILPNGRQPCSADRCRICAPAPRSLWRGCGHRSRSSVASLPVDETLAQLGVALLKHAPAIVGQRIPYRHPTSVPKSRTAKYRMSFGFRDLFPARWRESTVLMLLARATISDNRVAIKCYETGG
jgi:hypothetical protein